MERLCIIKSGKFVFTLFGEKTQIFLAMSAEALSLFFACSCGDTFKLDVQLYIN